MHHKSIISFQTILFVVLFFLKWTNAAPFQENPLTKAILLFDKGNFQEAEPLFRKILDERPDDFMVNYFYGACRTENGHYSEQDLSYLLKASKEVTPLDIDYYFGIQLHALNQWDNALRHYKLYKAVASANDREKVNLNLKMEQCINKINPFQTAGLEQITEEMPENLNNNQQAAEEIINFNINSEITYLYVSHFKTTEGEVYFKDGNTKQKELEAAVTQTEALREKYKSSKSWSEKDSIGKQILELESQTFELKNVVKQLFLQAKTAESSYWQTATTQETETFIREMNAAEQEIRNRNAVQTATVSKSPDIIIPSVLPFDKPTVRPVPKLKSSGATYKIQIGAYSRGIPNNMKSVFSKISVIRKVENYTDEKGVVVYTTGNLNNYEDALVMQKQVQQEGIKDAIIAAYLNGKRIPLEQAKEIEKEK